MSSLCERPIRDLKVKNVTWSEVLKNLEAAGGHEEFLQQCKGDDLVPGVYEGGLKVWECSIDMCEFLCDPDRVNLYDRKRVLELGCGAGLPGIVCLLKGAEQVCFQDFNPEVLSFFTKANVELNCSSSVASRSEFVASDWSMLGEALNNRSFDVVLACETIYNPENYDALYDAFSEHIALDGAFLLAAKSYYFGIGGSVKSFVEFVESRNKFTSQIVWRSQDASIKRQIVQFRHRRC